MKNKHKTLILVQILIIMFLFLSYIFLTSDNISILPKCMIKEKFGILCPACSGTSFAIEMANFHIKKAFITHPVFFILMVYLIVIDIIYIINILFSKNIKIFRWWHLLIWGIVLIIYTIIRNIV